MLKNLSIRNLALIRQMDIGFSDGLNILTGETGAGKSIIIDSITMALGGKVARSLVREDAPDALAELTFSVSDPETLSALAELEVFPEDGELVLSRRIRGGRSSVRVNGELRSAQEVREIGSLLLDIHGQSEHQKLLLPEHQLALLDAYGGEETAALKLEVSKAHAAYTEKKKALSAMSVPEAERARRADFLTFEISEIEEISPRIGEDEELEKDYRRLLHAQKIAEAAELAHSLTGYDDSASAGESIGRALKALEKVEGFDEEIGGLTKQLTEIDDLLNGFNRDVAAYLDGLERSEDALLATEERLNALNKLKTKHGRTLEEVLSSLAAKKAELLSLEDYEERRQKLQKEEEIAKAGLLAAADRLTARRVMVANAFADGVHGQLEELNFARCDFEVGFAKMPLPAADGQDLVTFRIATNPGQALLPLDRVVSGGELSRIMLGIKTLLSTEEKTGTLIFDEVDTGISGRTAQMVAKKLSKIARDGRQVLCITHLPQIAAFADAHYEIVKEISDEAAVTRIRKLSEEDSVRELARLLGGETITETTLRQASEMKDMARGWQDIS